jgi:hypothetical protein
MSTPRCLALVFVLASAVYGQGDADGYIARTFQAKAGEAPRMGWFAPGFGFVGQDDAPEVFILGPIGMPVHGVRKKPVSPEDLAGIRDIYRLACDVEQDAHLTSFDAGDDVSAQRALYLTRKVAGTRLSGLLSVSLTALQMAEINRVLRWPAHGTLRRDEAIGVRAGSFYYSLHKLYKRDSGLLSEEAIVLHSPTGQILAHELSRDLESDTPCDGCGLPRYIYPGSGLYSPLNMFEVPGFAYPLLLTDSSTVEGRALSLFTFDPDRKPANFRVYEYVVHCGP